MHIEVHIDNSNEGIKMNFLLGIATAMYLSFCAQLFSDLSHVKENVRIIVMKGQVK